jgi:hypothetical protein
MSSVAISQVIRGAPELPNISRTTVRLHPLGSTNDDLTMPVNVLPGWPAGSPGLKPVENLWPIQKTRVEELGPETKEELIDVIIMA